MKKVLAFLLAAFLLLSMVACAGDTGIDTQPSDNEIGNGDGTDKTPSAGVTDNVDISEILAGIPACAEIHFDDFKLLETDDYVALIFSGWESEDYFYAYGYALHDAGYYLSYSSDSEYDNAGMIQDYWSGMNADPNIRLVLSDFFAIIIGEQPPEASECFKLLDAIDSTSELRKSFSTYSNAVDIFAGEWVEQDGYGAMIFTDFADSAILDTLENDISHYSYRQQSSSTMGNAQLRRYRQSGVKDSDRYMGYNADTKTVVIVVGELPSEYTCWLLLGKTAEEIGEPKFADDVKDYMPDDAESCIQVHYSDMVSESKDLCVYQVCGVSLTRLEQYMEVLTDLGYTQTVRNDQEDSVYYEAQVKAYRDVDVYVTVQLAWADQKLTYAFSASGYAPEKGEIMQSTVTYTGSATGKDPSAAPDEGYQPLNLSTATRVESVGSNTIYYFEGANLVQSARLYIDALVQQGYKDEKMPYVPDIMPYQVEYAHNWLYRENAGNQSWVVVAAWNQMAVVITSAKEPVYREHDLWDMVGCYMQFGIGYLETVYTEFCNEHGVIGIGGESWDSNGYFANYGYDCTMDDVNWMIEELKKAGFTYSGQYTKDENGNAVDSWVYWRTEDYELLDTYIAARIMFKDGFAEVEFGYSYRLSSDNMP